ncbi:MAG TPA: hypothetical protein VMX17_15435 [Candidatus Glassbacteria bacterium]|nr:hypothetical protein [Candidatus Glassbacteria bacterium]
MNITEKKQLVQNLNEDELRQKVLIPLLSKMGFIDPIHHHHGGEKGKDIICKEYDDVFKKTKYLAVIVKKGNITGSSSSSDGYFNVINQVKQAINEPYKDIYELKEVYIDQCLLVASGRFLATSLDSIFGTLKSERIDKIIRDAIDIDKLISLIDEFYNEFWSEFIDEKKSLINQRNFLLNNISKLIKLIMPERSDQEKALKLMPNAEIDFELFPYNTTRKYIANVGYKKIEIDEIDEYFTDDIDNFYCDIKDYVFDLKKAAQGILYDIDDVVEILKDILEEKNPLKIIEYCEDLESHINGYGQIVFSPKDLHGQDDFYTALKEYQEKKELLINKNAFPLYNEINKDIKSKCKNGLVQFWKKHPRDKKGVWIGYHIQFSFEENKIISSALYDFERDLKQIETDSKWPSFETEILNCNEKDSISIELAINNYGILDEEKLSIEAKAESFIWHFRRPIMEKFIEMLSD